MGDACEGGARTQCPVDAARRPRSALVCNAPCPAAATTPRSPWRTCRPHWLLSPPSTPHPVDDAPTLELLVPCLTRGRAGAL
eukprot:2426820-Prymnesium_polylepis.1